MAIIQNSTSPLVARLQGVHLFGFDGAPCSQRVSFALAEKGLKRVRTVRWDSDDPAVCVAPPGGYIFRPVSLIKKAHMTPAYAAIQPNMVVPALVLDGTLVVESMDIVDFLESRWPEPALVPGDPEARALMHSLIELGKTLHVSVRYVSFHWGLGRLGRTSAAEEETIAKLERSESPEQLLAFYQRYNRGTIDEGVFLGHLAALEAGWGAQEARLAGDGRPFLTGGQFSRADILWAVKMQRIVECGYPFAARFPHLHAWFRRMQARPPFAQGVMGPNRVFHHGFRLKAAIENFLGFGIARVAGVKA